MKRAFIYCRVSSQKQVDEGHGLDGQQKRCTDYAKSHDYNVEAVFRDEAISGGIIDRPHMQRLLETLEKYKNENDELIVIIDDIKRLARDVQGHFTLKTAICSRNARLESPSHRFEDSPEGKFVETILAGAAELERNQNKKQVLNRMKARAEAGYWPFCLPPGLKNQKHPVHGKIAMPEEPIASIFKSAIEGYRDRALFTQHDVIAFIQNQYKLQGINRKISLHGVQQLLTEILYTGFVEYPKWGVTMRKGAHEGFISLETYKEVQRILKDRSKPKIRRDSNPDFPLRGLTLCSECHKPHTASFHHGRHGQLYPHYFCKTTGCPLKDKSIHRATIEEDFLKLLEAKKLDEPMKNLAIAVLSDVYKQHEAQLVDAEKIHQKRLHGLTEAITQITNRIAKTTNETLISTYEAELLKLGKQKEELHSVNYATRYTEEQFGTATKKVFTVLENPVGTWKTKNLDDQLTVFFMHFDQKPIYDKVKGFGTPTLSHSVNLIHYLGSGKLPSVEMPSNELGSERIQ